MSNEELFAGIDSLVYTLNNKKVKSINFDNAATTPPLKCVLDEIVGLSNYYASIGRGVGQKAEITTRLYNMSREYLLNYFNVKEKEKYIYFQTMLFLYVIYQYMYYFGRNKQK